MLINITKKPRSKPSLVFLIFITLIIGLAWPHRNLVPPPLTTLAVPQNITLVASSIVYPLMHLTVQGSYQALTDFLTSIEDKVVIMHWQRSPPSIVLTLYLYHP